MTNRLSRNHLSLFLPIGNLRLFNLPKVNTIVLTQMSIAIKASGGGQNRLCVVEIFMDRNTAKESVAELIYLKIKEHNGCTKCYHWRSFDEIELPEACTDMSSAG